ncbi:MAG: nucleotidyl transferase AbiEii/AbiGii toxin family protein [Candidatus Omnitrophica bacterium]|nr:nucleotidyl transferase AbiEii/AbiGii toxin family protein [Candidatus Omnitrophota bacterium]
MERYNSLQLREVFHIEFLRRLGRVIKAQDYAVKGGVALRFFFKSFRYSEDMDLDARLISCFKLKEAVIKILDDNAFRDTLKPFGITGIIPPNISRAKQTETTQRFKIHLVSSSGEDLFTKIEFSRRGLAGNVIAGTIDDAILRSYKLAPLLVPHYDSYSAIAQKLQALAGRKAVQARDIFDLYILSSQYTAGDKGPDSIETATLSRAYDRIFEVEFEQFRDTVVSYLSSEDQALYNKPESWAEVRLKAANFIEEVRKKHA